MFALLAIMAVATTLKAAFNSIDLKPGDPPPCQSQDEAKKKGVWICSVAVNPTTFEWNETTIQLDEAWIEEVTDDGYFLVWFSQRKKLGWTGRAFEGRIMTK